MNTLSLFSEKERNYFQYQERQEKTVALTEIERLKELLARRLN